ncbi:uncharacterized protein [Dysidea avara]|uniref:uncharacterized protein n=1 Tax=Dysidea avara TaxID=196820 RepID=UPI00332DC8D0
MTVVYWIQNSKPWKQYVSHRVNEIHQLTNRSHWRHCTGVLNPADLPSRGISGGELTSSSLWWNGPAFLQLDEEKWPLTDECCDMDEVVQSELTESSIAASRILAIPSNPVTRFPKLDQIIDTTRFSNLKSLLNTTAYILRFVKNTRRHDHVSRQNSALVQLNASEILNAEVYWIRSIQAAQFQPEIKIQFLETAKSPQPIRVLQFRLKLDSNHILRCQEDWEIPLLLSCNNPILLQPDHPYFKFLVLDAHLRVKHSGVETTLSTLRENYWILMLLKDDGTKRMFWKLAVLMELITGNDNQVKAAIIKVGDSPRLLKRSITHLVPLELNCQDV